MEDFPGKIDLQLAQPRINSLDTFECTITATMQGCASSCVFA